MVNSQVTSITPATHADRHSVGGADPLIAPLLPHHAQHETGGSDIVSVPAYIHHDYTADNAILHSNDTIRSVTVLAYQKFKEILLGSTPDEIRIYYYMDYISGTFANSCSYIARNGVMVGTEHTGIVDEGFYEDISGWLPGDLLQIYCKLEAAGESRVKNMRVCGIETAKYKEILDSELNAVKATNQDP